MRHGYEKLDTGQHTNTLSNTSGVFTPERTVVNFSLILHPGNRSGQKKGLIASEKPLAGKNDSCSTC
jgi:hypothetical protein